MPLERSESAKHSRCYKLDVEGVLNATDIHKNGAPLSVSQWEDVAGGITYGGGAVGIGKAPSTSYKLDVAGTLNATDLHKNGSPLITSQWADVSGGISYAAGNVGVRRLTVAATSVSNEFARGIYARAIGDGTGQKIGMHARSPAVATSGRDIF